MCKRDIESEKVASVSVLSTGGISKVRTWPGFRPGGYLRRVYLQGGYLRTPPDPVNKASVGKKHEIVSAKHGGSTDCNHCYWNLFATKSDAKYKRARKS